MVRFLRPCPAALAALPLFLLAAPAAAQGVVGLGPFKPAVPGDVDLPVGGCPNAPAAHLSGPTGGDFDSFASDALVDGNVLFVGRPGDDTVDTDVGAVLLHVPAGAGWTPSGTLFPGDGVVDQRFGQSLDLAGDLLVVGAPGSPSFGGTTGAAYVFERDPLAPNGWAETAKLEGPLGPDPAAFGQAVSTDGTTIVVGAPFEDTVGAASGGAVYVFERDAGAAGAWTETARLIAAVPNGGILGASVDVEGDLLIAGAPYLAVEFISGSAFTFRRTGSVWAQEQKLTSSLAGGRDRFGTSVALAGDELFVGSPRDTPPSIGAVYRFRAGERGFQVSSVHFAPDFAPFDRFGTRLSHEGQRLLVGAPSQNGGLGAAYLYDLSSGRLKLACELPLPPAQPFAQFGSTVRLAGTRALVGAPFDDVLATDDGSLAVFELGLPPKVH